MKQSLSPVLQALQYVNIVLAEWRKIVLFGVCFFLFAAALMLARPRSYASTATLAVYPPPFKLAGGTQEIASMMPSAMHVLDYEKILSTDAALSMVRESLPGGVLTEDEFEKYSDIANLRDALSSDIEINQKSAYGTDYSKVIQLTAEASRPEIAALLANTWATVTQMLVTEYNSRTKQVSADYLGGEHEGVGESLKDFEDKYQTAENMYAAEILTFEKETEDLKTAMDTESDKMAQELVSKQDREIRDLKVQLKLDLVAAELSMSTDRIMDWEQKLVAIAKAKADDEEQLKQLEAELQKQDQYIVVSKAITDEALWESLNPGNADGGLPQDLQNLKLRDETLNPVYLTLKDKIAVIRVELSSLPQQERYLIQREQEERDRLDELDKKLHAGQFQVGELEREHTLQRDALKRERDTLRQKLVRQREEDQLVLKREATLQTGRLNRELENQKQKYNILASQALNANLALADSTTDIAPIGKAVPVDKPTGLPRTVLALTFGIFGVLVGVAWVLVEYVYYTILPRLRALGTPDAPGGNGRGGGSRERESLTVPV